MYKRVVLYCLSAMILPIYVYSNEAADSAAVKETASAAVKDSAAAKEAESAKETAAPTKVINGIECVLVKAGKFMMGNHDAQGAGIVSEAPHWVTLTKDYWISKCEITQKQYLETTGVNPSAFTRSEDLPVENVSWNDAAAFCKKIGGRLPTEAEWEFAALGGNMSKGYIYSGGNDLNEVGWYEDNSDYETKPVGTKAPNELGIYDMSGNVWEWVSDWYGSYPSGSVVDPTGPVSGSSRVCRGGGWYDLALICRVASRGSISPSNSDYDLGLRVAFNAN